LFAALLMLPVLVLAGYGMPSLGGASAASLAPSADTVLDALEAALGEIYEQVNPSVVNIQVVGQAQGLPWSHPEIPGLPSEPSLPQEPFQQQGLGSGFVWDKEGHIVTNAHVVADAEKIVVTFHDDTTVPAEVVGTDRHSDLAVIKVDLPLEKLQPVQMADSTQVHVGQLAVAIGNPFGLEGTMTVGFVSALGRSLPVASGNMLASSYTIPDIIQTDAPINPGNSGGVLVDDGGRVIGVPTAIESPVQANAGIGFAVPSAIVQNVVPVLIEDGAYEHPWLGISGTSLTSELAEAMELDTDQRGVLVIEVVEDGPAEEAGLQGSDREIELEGRPVRVGGFLIVAVDSQPIREFEDLVAYLVRSTSVGERTSLTIVREGREETVHVTLAARPQEEEPQELAAARTASGAWLGIRGLTVTPEIAEAMDLSPDQRGVLVETVLLDTPADRAGLLGGDEAVHMDGQELLVGGDIIIAAESEPVMGMEGLLTFLRQAEPEQEVALTLLHDSIEVTQEVTLGERPTSGP
jgi:S1-C subfamily serine protease